MNRLNYVTSKNMSVGFGYFKSPGGYYRLGIKKRDYLITKNIPLRVGYFNLQ